MMSNHNSHAKNFAARANKLNYVRAGVIGMRVSPGFPAQISLGMRVSPHMYH